MFTGYGRDAKGGKQNEKKHNTGDAAVHCDSGFGCTCTGSHNRGEYNKVRRG
ncbi:MAG: hypothetical protein U9O53_05780 [archaeon]|nr:hypothetical protein [archaeon]